MPAHIGIVACSAEGASLCYRTICIEGAARMGGHAHPEVSLHGFSLEDYTQALDAGDSDAVGGLMLASAEKLAAAGADFLICPDNTIHAALPAIRDRSPVPWLHIAEVAVDRAIAAGQRTLGLTGTHWLVESDVYDRVAADRGVVILRPSAEDIVGTGDLIMDDLVRGRFTDAGRTYFNGVLGRLKAAGAEAALLACTELPLIADDTTAPLPTLDTTRLLARAALDRALADQPM